MAYNRVLNVHLEISAYLVFVAALLLVYVSWLMVMSVAKTHNATVITVPLVDFVYSTQEEVVN